MSRPHPLRQRALLVPETIQASSMDCGPAALSAWLAGMGTPLHLGHLREVCQTTVDGTSIDQLEAVAAQLGQPAEQVMVPVENLLLSEAQVLPAVVVVAQPDGSTHFVVVWSRWGPWLQTMDPAHGREWVWADAFKQKVHKHRHQVPAEAWRSWALSDGGWRPLAQRLNALGLGAQDAARWRQQVDQDPLWFSCAALEAATRLAEKMVAARGLAAGKQAAKLVEGLWQETLGSEADIYKVLPEDLWSVVPDHAGTRAEGVRMLWLTGAVALRMNPEGQAVAPDTVPPDAGPLTSHLAEALRQKDPHPLQDMWAWLQANRSMALPVVALGAAAVSLVLVIEVVLFNAVLDLAPQLTTPLQRWAGGAVCGVLLLAVLAMDWSLNREVFRQGRHLELRLRMAWLDKLPRLHDRYFQSRPASDMADRSHAVSAVRQIPQWGAEMVLAATELGLTALALAVVAPRLAVWITLVCALAVVLPWVFQRLLTERDMRVRGQSAALSSVYLDALLGQVAVRSHSAQPTLSRRHEAQLVRWQVAWSRLATLGLGLGHLQGLVNLLLSSALVWAYLGTGSAPDSTSLLVLYWSLKLPASGSRLSAGCLRYPAFKNIWNRLMEPMRSPSETDAPTDTPPHFADTAERRSTSVYLSQVGVKANGQTVLSSVSLSLRPGEHVALVGHSGSGKSSLMGLLLGWHRPSQGELLVDGLPLEGGVLKRLREDTAWVDPAIQLWDQSLLDNLLHASGPAGLDRLDAALDAADLRGVLGGLPQGLQGGLGEGGASVSGGEGQRVRLARAMLQPDPRLVLLDEPFRGLDRGQRRLLLENARQWWSGTTLLCAMHDIESTRSFDRVLVMDGGELVQDGSPQKLAAVSGPYRDLLEAEQMTHQVLWGNARWQHWRLHKGHLETGA